MITKPFPCKPATRQQRLVSIKTGTSVLLPKSTWKAGKVKCGFIVYKRNDDGDLIVRFMSGIHWTFPIELYFDRTPWKKGGDHFSMIYGSGGHHENNLDPEQIAEVQASLFTKAAEIVKLIRKAL